MGIVKLFIKERYGNMAIWIYGYMAKLLNCQIVKLLMAILMHG
jgi:hypothetical protein